MTDPRFSTEFLIWRSRRDGGSINDEIAHLRDASQAFRLAWREGDTARAQSISDRAADLLAKIYEPLLRFRDDHLSEPHYEQSSFACSLRRLTAELVKPVTDTDQEDVTAQRRGESRFPEGLSSPSEIKLETTLNKLKHRHEGRGNFRLEGDEHVLVICPTAIGGGPDSIVEIEITRFCNAARDAANSIEVYPD